MRFKKEILLIATSLVISLVIIEFCLRAFTIFPIHGRKSNNITHPVLGYTLDPSKLSDADSSGFRNPVAGGQHEIVAIGDSHTYGNNVEWKDAWPYQLGRALNKSIYNYGIGGYGIYHYPYLASQAISHKPEYVILAFYPGNDIQRYTCNYVSASYYKELFESKLTQAECIKKPRSTKAKKREIKLKNYSALLSSLSYLRKKYLNPIKAKLFTNKNYFYIGDIIARKSQVFKRNEMTNLQQPEVKANFEASKTILSMIRDKLHKRGIKFGVVIIPSKGLVIEQWAKNNKVKLPEKFNTTSVKALINKYISFFEDEKIFAIDSTPFVVEAFTKSVELKEDFYPLGDDHPLVRGYGSYSLAAAELISKINHGELN